MSAAGQAKYGSPGGAGEGVTPSSTRAYVLVPVVVTSSDSLFAHDVRDAAARLDEAVGLARAIDLEVVGSAALTVKNPRPATLLGTGKVEELAAPTSPVRFSAREILGLAAYKAGDYAKAKDWMQKIVDDNDAPAGARTRARMVLGMITASGKLS